MRCIFCKMPSFNSKSIEHIIPESLGNTDHTLPKGVVCDSCNNYFACNVEAKILSSIHFRNLRSRQKIYSKKGNIPSTIGAILKIPMEIQFHTDGSISPLYEKDSNRLVTYFQENKSGQFIIPTTITVDSNILQRFIAKIALEVLTQKIIGIEGWEKEIIDKPELDLIRDFARRGYVVKNWPIYQRNIYHEDYSFNDGHDYQVLHEFTLLYTNLMELYVVICIFGVEYTINLGGPEIKGYQVWLKENSYKSPLYCN